jgi:hypothetical protein
LKKHANSDHAIIVKKIEEEINALTKGPFERESIKKKNVLGSAIFKFFLLKIFFKKMMNNIKIFYKILVF